MKKPTKRKTTLRDAQLAALVEIYCNKYEKAFENKISAFRDLNSFAVAVKVAANGKEVSRKTNKHLHWLFSVSRKPSLKKAVKILTKQTAELELCVNFQQLHQTITNLVGHLRHVKKVYCYDVALRIGSAKNIFPEKVYVHAAKVKAAAIKLRVTIKNDDTVDHVSFPPVLHLLKAYQIEDFLCVFESLRKQIHKRVN